MELDATLKQLMALQEDPRHATLVDDVEQALAIDDPRVLIAACAALNARAALRPLDAPPENPVAQRVVELTARITLEGELAAYLWINRANALRALGPDGDSEATDAYLHALSIVDKGAWHFDLGVHHKWRGRFHACYESMLRARARLGETRPVLWNMAIAATGAGKGDLAAGAWRDLGLDVSLNEKSRLPILADIPPMQVRAPSRPTGRGFDPPDNVGFEVVTVQPISPCHGVVSTPSFEDTPIDYGDIVMWDGAPVAESCFPLLEILRRGDELRLPFVAIVQESVMNSLVDTLGHEVRVFVHPAGTEQAGERLVYGKLIAPSALSKKHLVSAWTEAVAKHGVRVAIPELYEGVDTRRAGQEHQAWRGVERAAQKRGLVG